jgi:hypothetical protein
VRKGHLLPNDVSQLWGQLPESGSQLLLKVLQYFEIIYHVQEEDARSRYYLVPHLLEVLLFLVLIDVSSPYVILTQPPLLSLTIATRRTHRTAPSCGQRTMRSKRRSSSSLHSPRCL